MHRTSNRLAALAMALVLLIAPVSLYAAPSTDSGLTGWGAAVLDTLDTWVRSAWNGIEGLIGTGDGLTDDGLIDGQDPTTSSDPNDPDAPLDPGSDTEVRPGVDPWG